MEIIAKINRDTVLCRVNLDEVDKFYNTYYRNKEIAFDIGDEIDLGRGYDFHRDMKDALKTIQTFVEAGNKLFPVLAEALLRIEPNENNE